MKFPILPEQKEEGSALKWFWLFRHFGILNHRVFYKSSTDVKQKHSHFHATKFRVNYIYIYSSAYQI